MSEEHEEIINEYGRYAQMPLALLAADTKFVSNTAKVLYAWLWKYSDSTAGRTAYPGRRKLAAHLGTSIDTVDRCVKQLVRCGAISVSPRHDSRGDRTSNLYKILVLAEGGGRTHAAGWPQFRDGGGRTGAAGVAAGEGQDQEPLVQEPTDQLLPPSEISLSEAFASDVEKGKVTREHIQLCELLRELVVANGNRPPKIGKAWIDAARLLMTTDGISYADAEEVLRWSQRDEFWRTNVLSMPTFRKQFDQLRGRMRRKPNTGGLSGRNARNLAVADLFDEPSFAAVSGVAQ